MAIPSPLFPGTKRIRATTAPAQAPRFGRLQLLDGYHARQCDPAGRHRSCGATASPPRLRPCSGAHSSAFLPAFLALAFLCGTPATSIGGPEASVTVVGRYQRNNPGRPRKPDPGRCRRLRQSECRRGRHAGRSHRPCRLRGCMARYRARRAVPSCERPCRPEPPALRRPAPSTSDRLSQDRVCSPRSGANAREKPRPAHATRPGRVGAFPLVRPRTESSHSPGLTGPPQHWGAESHSLAPPSRQHIRTPRPIEAKPQAFACRRFAVERTHEIDHLLPRHPSSSATSIAVFIGLAIEKVAPAISMPIFLTMYFAVLWGAWVIAVRMTEPKKIASAPLAGATSDQRA